MRRFVVLALFCIACGSSAPRVAASVGGHRVGDYVVYRYAGRLIGPDPMLLMEEVVAQDGERFVIEATLTRGHETVRAWRQTMAGTDVVSLCQIEGDACTPLANEGGADLTRMHEGLFVPADGPASEVTESDEERDVGGTTMTCHLRQSSITREGEPLVRKEYDCPDFLWRDGGEAVEMPDKRRVLWVTVQSFGSAD